MSIFFTLTPLKMDSAFLSLKLFIMCPPWQYGYYNGNRYGCQAVSCFFIASNMRLHCHPTHEANKGASCLDEAQQEKKVQNEVKVQTELPGLWAVSIDYLQRDFDEILPMLLGETELTPICPTALGELEQDDILPFFSPLSFST